MESLPSELIYVLMFLAIALFQYVIKRFGPQAPREPAQEERPEQVPELPEDAPAAIGVAGSTPGNGAAPRRRRFSRNALMGNQREVQNAVVIATILGPCRAFEPHEIR